jgi:hypothetical protein
MKGRYRCNMLSRIVEPDRKEVQEGWRKFHTEEPMI